MLQFWFFHSISSLGPHSLMRRLLLRFCSVSVSFSTYCVSLCVLPCIAEYVCILAVHLQIHTANSITSLEFSFHLPPFVSRSSFSAFLPSASRCLGYIYFFFFIIFLIVRSFSLLSRFYDCSFVPFLVYSLIALCHALLFFSHFSRRQWFFLAVPS